MIAVKLDELKRGIVLFCDKPSVEMEVGIARIATDEDFIKLKTLVDSHDGWHQDYDKGSTKVWSQFTQQTNFKMIKVCI